jgi:hypothetical protein
VVMVDTVDGGLMKLELIVDEVVLVADISLLGT